MRLIDADKLKSLIYDEDDDERYGYIDVTDINAQPTITIAGDIYEMLCERERILFNVYDKYGGGEHSLIMAIETRDIRLAVSDMITDLYDTEKEVKDEYNE